MRASFQRARRHDGKRLARIGDLVDHGHPLACHCCRDIHPPDGTLELDDIIHAAGDAHRIQFPPQGQRHSCGWEKTCARDPEDQIDLFSQVTIK